MPLDITRLNLVLFAANPAASVAFSGGREASVMGRPPVSCEMDRRARDGRAFRDDLATRTVRGVRGPRVASGGRGFRPLPARDGLRGAVRGLSRAAAPCVPDRDAQSPLRIGSEHRTPNRFPVRLQRAETRDTSRNRTDVLILSSPIMDDKARS